MPSRKFRVFWIFAVIIVACTVSWIYLQGTEPGSPKSPGHSELRQAPSFSLKDSSGAVHTLTETRGKTTLVHFWAAWCPPCLQEIPDLVEFAEHFQNAQNNRLEVVAISLDPRWEDAEKVLSSSKLPKNMISLLDGGSNTSEAYGTYQYPETYLLNPEGRVLAKWVGPQPWNSPQTYEAIQRQISATLPH